MDASLAESHMVPLYFPRHCFVNFGGGYEPPVIFCELNCNDDEGDAGLG